MKRADRPAEAGYTIVETMIFLIVTGVLMASAALLFNGKINRSQFVQSVHQFNNSVANTINAVSTGTYDHSQSFNCTGGAPTRSPQVTAPGSNGQGANTGCIVVGQIIHGNIPGQQGKVNTYTVIANRLQGVGGNDITGLSDPAARPIVLDSYSTGTDVDLTRYQTLPAGLTVNKMIALGASGNTGIGAIGVFQTFGQRDDRDVLQSGAQNVQIMPIYRDSTNSGIEQTGSTGLDNFVAYNLGSSQPNASKGILICLTDGSQYGTVTIGLNNGTLTTTVNIGQDSRC